MNTNLFSLLIMASILLPTLAIGLEKNNMEKQLTLNKKEQCIILIAAFTAGGDINRLKPALNEGLDAGLKVNEIKEILVQSMPTRVFPEA